MLLCQEVLKGSGLGNDGKFVEHIVLAYLDLRAQYPISQDLQPCTVDTTIDQQLLTSAIQSSWVANINEAPMLSSHLRGCNDVVGRDQQLRRLSDETLFFHQWAKRFRKRQKRVIAFMF